VVTVKARRLSPQLVQILHVAPTERLQGGNNLPFGTGREASRWIVETLVKDENKTQVEPAARAARQDPDRREEIDELLRIKRVHRFDAGQVPCPSCTVVVDMTINRCPFCESDIAAETALARETTRRLRELSGELDAEHGARSTDEEPPRRGFLARLKYLFEGDPEPDPFDAIKVDPHARRLLGVVSPGDVLKVLEEDGPWLKIKTAGGAIGWVYSTVREDS
jgi:hypothetical protein